jgi:hypothetical protein
LRDGEFFVTALFNELGRGKALKEGFEVAAEKTTMHTDSGSPSTTQCCSSNRENFSDSDTAKQHPLLDDNGDGQGSHDLFSGSDGNVTVQRPWTKLLLYGNLLTA